MPQDRRVGSDIVLKHRALPTAAEPARHKVTQTLWKNTILQTTWIHQDRKRRTPHRRLHTQKQSPQLLLLPRESTLASRQQGVSVGVHRFLEIQLHRLREGDWSGGQADDPQKREHDEQVPLRKELQVDLRREPPRLRKISLIKIAKIIAHDLDDYESLTQELRTFN